jgi:hypothetical protein
LLPSLLPAALPLPAELPLPLPVALLPFKAESLEPGESRSPRLEAELPEPGERRSETVEGWATGAAKTEVERAKMAVAKMVLESMVAVLGVGGWWRLRSGYWTVDERRCDCG